MNNLIAFKKPRPASKKEDLQQQIAALQDNIAQDVKIMLDIYQRIRQGGAGCPVYQAYQREQEAHLFSVMMRYADHDERQAAALLNVSRFELRAVLRRAQEKDGDA